MLAKTRPFPCIPSPSRFIQSIKSRSQLADAEIATVLEVLSRYKLEMTAGVTNISGGFRNLIVMVNTSIGKKVLKVYRPDWQQSTIIYEHSILNRLAEINYPAPRLVATPQGDTFVSVGNQNFALLEFVDGFNYASCYLLRSHRLTLMAVAGKMLAQFHRCLEGFMPDGQHHLGFKSYTEDRKRDLDWHIEKLTELQEKSHRLTKQVDKQYADWLIQKSRAVQNELCQLQDVLAPVPLPRLIIHGDYGIHNLLFRRDRGVTLLDFELARLEWRLSDLIMVLSRVDFNSFQSFITAYQAEFPLTSEEWHYFPQIWKLRMLQGAVQYWNNYFELGGSHRLAGAYDRINRADWGMQHKSQLLKMRYASPEKRDERPVRVLMVTRLFYPWIGGAERQAHKLAQQLIEKDVPVEIVTGWWFQKTHRSEIFKGVPVYRNFTLWNFFGIRGLRKFGGYLYILTLLWYLWRNQKDYDVVHVHGLNYHTFAVVLASHLCRKKTLAKLVNSGEASDIHKMRRNQQLALSRYMLPTALKCDQFVAINQTIFEELVAAGVPSHKIVRIGNGIDTNAILPKSCYSLNDPVRLIYVGRLHEQKGLDVLLNASEKLFHQYPESRVCVHILGDGPLKGDLTRLAERLGISKQIEFFGQTENVLEHLLQADIFVLPSRAEGMSNALLEAMACSLPVVVSNIPGNTDIIENEVNGLLFTVNNPISLAKNLEILIRRPDLRERLGKAARQTVESRYSLDRITDHYIALYRNLLRDGIYAVEGNAPSSNW